MKRSRIVPIFLLGAAITSLQGCDNSYSLNVRRQTYPSMEACQNDWAPQDCQINQNTDPKYDLVGGYFGPKYFWDRTSQKPMMIKSDGTFEAITDGQIIRTADSNMRFWEQKDIVGTFTVDGYQKKDEDSTDTSNSSGSSSGGSSGGSSSNKTTGSPVRDIIRGGFGSFHFSAGG